MNSGVSNPSEWDKPDALLKTEERHLLRILERIEFSCHHLLAALSLTSEDLVVHLICGGVFESQYGRQGIRVDCICPGDVDTPMLPEEARMRGLKWEDYLAGCANRPLGRIGTVDEIAKAVLFLASDDSSFMTGAALVVDGGGIAD